MINGGIVLPGMQYHSYTKPRIVLSLRTRSAPVTGKVASLLTARFNEYWLSLRRQKHDIIRDGIYFCTFTK